MRNSPRSFAVASRVIDDPFDRRHDSERTRHSCARSRPESLPSERPFGFCARMREGTDDEHQENRERQQQCIAANSVCVIQRGETW